MDLQLVKMQIVSNIRAMQEIIGQDQIKEGTLYNTSYDDLCYMQDELIPLYNKAVEK